METPDRINIDISRLFAVVGGWPRGNHKEIQRHLNILGISNVRMLSSLEEAPATINKDEADIFLCNVNGSRAKAHSVCHPVPRPLSVFNILIAENTKNGRLHGRSDTSQIYVKCLAVLLTISKNDLFHRIYVI